MGINEAHKAKKRCVMVNRGDILPEDNDYDPANNQREIGQWRFSCVP